MHPIRVRNTLGVTKQYINKNVKKRKHVTQRVQQNDEHNNDV